MSKDEMEEMLLGRELYQRLWLILEDLETVLWEIEAVNDDREQN